jgi:hypothetical protein
VRRFGIFDHLDGGGYPLRQLRTDDDPAQKRMGARRAGTVLRRHVVDRDTRDTATQARERGAVSPYRLFGSNSCPFAETAFEIIEDRVAVALAGSFSAEPAIEQHLAADREDDTRHLHSHRQAERSSSPIGHDIIL